MLAVAEVVVPVVIVSGFGLVAWLAAKASKASHANGEALAARLGLSLEATAPWLGWFYPAPRGSGRVRGKRMEFFSYTTGSGKSRKSWVALAVTPARNSGLTFALTRQGLGSRVRSLFGATEIEVGDRHFDERWFIETNQPDFFRAALLPELRAKLMELDRKGLPGSLRTENGTVKYAEPGTFQDRARCERLAALGDVLCDLADIVEVWAEHAHPGGP